MTEEGRKVGTYRGAPTGFVRDFSNVEGVKGGGEHTGEEAGKTGSRCRAAGANRDLGSRSRAERQRYQGWAVGYNRSGSFSRWTGDPRP